MNEELKYYYILLKKVIKYYTGTNINFFQKYNYNLINLKTTELMTIK